MDLIRLVYFSTVAEGVSKADLKNILLTSNRNNAMRDITGALAVTSRHFIQALEGKRETVSALVKDIMNDTRNSDLTITSVHPIEQRAFAGWSMLWLGRNALTRTLSMKHLGQERIDPPQASAEGLEHLLIDAARTNFPSGGKGKGADPQDDDPYDVAAPS